MSAGSLPVVSDSAARSRPLTTSLATSRACRLAAALVMRWGLVRRLVHRWCRLRPSTRVLLAALGVAGVIVVV